MKKLIILFLLLFSFSVISSEKENILFENDIYRLSLDSSGNCSKLNLFNKFSYKATCFNYVNQEIFLNLYSKKTIYYILIYRIAL